MYVILLFAFLPFIFLAVTCLSVALSVKDVIKMRVNKKLFVNKQKHTDVPIQESVLDHKLAMLDFIINDMVNKKYPDNNTWTYICNSNNALLFHGCGHILVNIGGRKITEKVVAENLFQAKQTVYFQSDADAEKEEENKTKVEQVSVAEKVALWLKNNITMILDRTKIAQNNGDDFITIGMNELESCENDYVYSLCELLMERGYLSAEKNEESSAIIVGVPID